MRAGARRNGGCVVSPVPCVATSGRPSSPYGRTTSTAAMTTNTSTSVDCGSSQMPNACRTPMISEAQNAPVIEPRPPTTTTTKASTRIVRSICRLTVSRGICSAPASPASPAPSANTVVKSNRSLTPSAPAISRSCVAARTIVPQRVRWNSHHNSPNITGPTTVSSRLYSGTSVEPNWIAPLRPGARGANCSSGPHTASTRSCMIKATPNVASSWKISGTA